MDRAAAGRLGAQKSLATHQKQKHERVEAYTSSPTLCAYCNTALEYAKRKNRFCDKSCAAKLNNQSRNRHEGRDTGHPCAACGTKVSTNRTYCTAICRTNARALKVEATISNSTLQDTPKQSRVSTKRVRKFLIELRGSKCENCGWSELNPASNTVPIEMDHIDGDSENNSIDNLRLLCPNCHSLTPTYKNLNRGKGRQKRRDRYAQGKSY